MDNPKVSIIMGVYNCESTVASAVDSIIAQSFQNWEFVICDDCSTDNTLKVIYSLAEKDPRIKIIRNKVNSKLAYSLNHCLRESRGEYIARMDADDISLPQRLEKQVAFLDAHPEYAVVGGGIIRYNKKFEQLPYIPVEIPDQHTLLRGAPFLHPTVMVRSEIYRELGGYLVAKRTIKGQDLDLWYRLYAKGYKGYNLQEAILKYHEDIDDYKKKRNLVAAIGIAKTKYIGFKANKFPFYVYIFVITPIISAIIPKSILYKKHNKEG